MSESPKRIWVIRNRYVVDPEKTCERIVPYIRADLIAEPEVEPMAWIPEDELSESYPYDLMFQYSKVDIIRWFPIYGPPRPKPDDYAHN